jgi:sirohydrochlorin ferrochelatase
VQVDADGQHAIEDIPQLLALAQAYPTALISGRPFTTTPFPAHASMAAGLPTSGCG